MSRIRLATGERLVTSGDPAIRLRRMAQEPKQQVEADDAEVTEPDEEALEIAEPGDDQGDTESESPRIARLSEAQIEEVARRLRAGRRLPPHLVPYLFETPKEYGLAYAGKMRRADVLAETMALPLQPVRRNRPADPSGWINHLVFGDNLQALKYLLEEKEKGRLTNADGTDGPRLVYIDPPFATGEAWESRQGRVAYDDKVRGAQFIEWLRRRLILLAELLADDGSIVVHLDHRYVHYIKVILDEILPGNFRNDIIVPRGVKGVQSQFEQIDALALGHYTLLLYSKRSATKYPKLFDEGAKPARWDTFWLGTDRKTMRYELFGTTPSTGQWRWKKEKAEAAIENYKRYLKEAPDLDIEEYAAAEEERTGERPDFLREGEKGPQWYRYAKTQQLASDVWDVKTKGSKTDFPTEKHEDLLERLIDWLTDEGDLVLDAFVGSGTTPAVAHRLDRRWIGIDSTRFAIYTTQARLLRQASDTSTGFVLDMAGLYDYDLLRSLPWDDYRAFVLQLFQCRREEASLGGVHFDGVLGDDRVLVYDFNAHDGARIGQSFVEDIAELAGSRLGARCFIVAPALAVEPYEDYIDVGDTRFFFLRIPYSIIAELHKRAFTELRQPQSVDDVNEFIESVGFDFIQPPRVECDYSSADGALSIQIRAFESEAYAASYSEENISDLAMVMVDLNYDSDIFDLDEVFYGEDLAEKSWTIELNAGDVGDEIMLVYLDVYGNEHRELKTPADFTGAKKATKRKPKAAEQRATKDKPAGSRRASAKAGSAKATTPGRSNAKRSGAKKSSTTKAKSAAPKSQSRRSPKARTKSRS
jgi:hypothetical protein